MTTQVRNDQLVDLLKGDFYHRGQEIWQLENCDVRPNDGRVGLGARHVDRLGLTFFLPSGGTDRTHWRDGATTVTSGGAAYGWQGGIFSGAAPDVTYANIGDDFIRGACSAADSYYARLITTYLGQTLYARIWVGQLAKGGLRIENSANQGTQFCEFLLSCTAIGNPINLVLREPDGVGGILPTTFAATVQPDTFVTIGLPWNASNNRCYCYLYPEAPGRSHLLGFSAVFGWTPDRAGIVYYKDNGTGSVVLDSFRSTFS